MADINIGLGSPICGIMHDIVAQGGRAYSVIGDLTNDDEVRRLFDEARAFVRPIEIVVNNAGGSGTSDQLLERIGRTLELTAKARALADPVKTILSQISDPDT
ncbi:MAG: 3-oxoacyl-acyl-carrier-protein reductase [Cypionkella sp.]|uniref:hypothetical protein n=1 Tax=Cypionkella sp. TaxID=2811411 RepID=UPI002608F878|nr:hypothetical protein [Cypionkella sp.]MDB5659257.1 3-oxoacyl-acyl-carrier-protein reductase [Cypionkella sp.]